MNKFKYYFILIITSLSLFSCSKDDNSSIEAEPLRDFQKQFTTDNTTIEEYLKTYSFLVTNEPGDSKDQDVAFTKIPTGGSERSIMSYLNSSTFPKLLKKNLELHGIVYEIYYLVLREGTGDKPCNVDGVLSSYRGQYLYKTTVSEVTTLTPIQFEEVKYPQTFLNLYETITGWSEIFPEFRTGNSTPYKDPNNNNKEDGTLVYTDFGAGVMFLPSGLGYYSSGSGSIPSYVPLVFSFKLYAIKRSDLDNDGIPSYLEDLNGDNYVRTFAAGVTNPDDFDKDGIPDYLDIDDDGDSYLTRSEITVNGVVAPFASIPDCSGNTTDASRVKKHLDKNCH